MVPATFFLSYLDPPRPIYNALVKVNPCGGHHHVTLRILMGSSDHTGDYDRNSFQHHSDITNDRKICFVSGI